MWRISGKGKCRAQRKRACSERVTTEHSGQGSPEAGWRRIRKWCLLWWVKSHVILLGYRSKLWFSALTHPLGWTFLCGSLYSAQAGSEQSLEHVIFIREPHLLKGRGRKQVWAEESQPVFQAQSSSANPAPGHRVVQASDLNGGAFILLPPIVRPRKV